MSTTVIRCKDCDQILNGKIQVYTDKTVLCEICNVRRGEEVPKRK